ncbi:uncharacterized protein C2orf81 homolog [Lithobates pipiens]
MSGTRSGAPGRSTATPGQGVSRVAASKSRTEKTRTVTVAPLPPVSVDVIPGRLTEEDWNSMVTTEEGEEVVGEIVDSLIGRVMDECYKVYIQRQLIPFTISRLRDVMSHMVEWTFIPRDEGENETRPEETRQEEPQPCPNDSWAQGCVPLTQPVLTARSSTPQAPSGPPITCIPEQEAEPEPQEVEISKSPDPSEDRPPSSRQLDPSPEEKTEKEASVTQKSPVVIKPTPPPNPPKKKSVYRPYRGPLRSAGLKNITKSLEDTEKEIILEEFLNVKEESGFNENINLLPPSLHNILKIQLGRPPQKTNVIYDDEGNVLLVPKLDLAKLPRHHVRPRIEVLDCSKEAECRGRKSGQAEVRTPIHQPQKEKRIRDKGQPKWLQITGQKRGPSTSDSQTLQAYTFTTTDHGKGPVPTTAGLNLDTIQLSHGVILREGNTTERGSIQSLRQRELAWREESRQLQPIRPSITLPSLSVDQLIKNNIPQVQPLRTFMLS